MAELLRRERRSSTPVPTQTQPVVQGRRLHPWAWGITLACLVLVGSALGYLLHDAVQANHRYDRARVSLATTRHHTAVVSFELAQARTDLALLTRQVGNDTTALAQDTSALQGARAALSAAETHVSAQATLLASLHKCLGGVERALNALAVANQPRAIAALDAVAPSCSAAVAASG
jgi:hypothetical protein